MTSCPGAIDQSMSTADGREVFFVRADGTAQKNDAKDPANASTSMSLATFNANAFNPGDTVVVSGAGVSSYISQLTVPSSGNADVPFVVMADRSVPPSIQVTGTDRCIYVFNKSYVDIGFFPDLRNNGPSAGTACVEWGGASIGCRAEDVDVTRNRNPGATVAGDCFATHGTSTVVARNLSGADFKGSGGHQAFTSHDTTTFDVHGGRASNGQQGAVPVGTSRLRLYGVFMDDMENLLISVDANGVCEVYNSLLLGNNATGSTVGVGSGAEENARLSIIDSDVHATSALTAQTTVAGRGLLEFIRGRVLSESDNHRWVGSTASSTMRAKGTQFILPNVSNGIFVSQPGAVQVQDCYFDMTGLSGVNKYAIWWLDTSVSSAANYVRGSVFANFGTATGALWMSSASGSPIDLTANTFWNASKAGTAINNARTAPGITARRNGFSGVVTSYGGEGLYDEFGSDYYDADRQGSGDPLLHKPSSGDFRVPINSPWNKVGDNNNDADIGANKRFEL